MAIDKRLIDKMNRINEALKPLEHARKQIEKLQRGNELLYVETKSDFDYFKDELIKYSDPCDYFVIEFMRNKLDAFADRKKASEFIIKCMSIALNNEKSGVITRDKISQLNALNPLESVYRLFAGDKTAQESSIIIAYLCLYIEFLHKSDLQRNDTNQKAAATIKTHGFYEVLLPEAISIIERELSGGERRKATIAKILKRELTPKCHRIPCHNTLLNWINEVIKSRQK
ncbi:hypothetical protein MKI77_004070 [Escherichia coli]|nr:hypothetical protein [Escherichia coli]